MTYQILNESRDTDESLVKGWTSGVPVEDGALKQLRNVAKMPFIHSHVAVMPDVHQGIGATIGSVVPTLGAIIPAAVGVDIGCGMIASQLVGVTASDLPDNLKDLRSAIENDVPVGFTAHENPEVTPSGLPALEEFLHTKHPKLGYKRKHSVGKIVTSQYGTLGGGNHFIELCVDTNRGVWIMLHSGSRGIGNTIGQYFIELAREDMRKWHINLPDRDLAYLPEGTDHFDDYVWAVRWAQDYAAGNRRRMLILVEQAIRETKQLPDFTLGENAVNCHHNYVGMENHFGKNIFVTRKGAVRARKGDMGIIPGSMGARSFIVRGKGNPDSFMSCSHGAGRVMSRTEAKRLITLDQHVAATEGIECRKDDGVIDESPAAYKDIDAVMAAQSDLIEIVHELSQVLCVKG